MRRPALIALAVLTVAPASACGDFLSSDDDGSSNTFSGSFDAQQLIPSSSGGNLLAQGWQVGITFISSRGVYLVVGMPPEQEFGEPQISLGAFSTEVGADEEQRINFTDEENEPLEVGEVTVEGTQGNEVVQFDFEQGSLGFLQMRTTPSDFGDISTTGGTYTATEFVLLDDEGNSIDLAADPDAAVTLGLQVDPTWPMLGGYQLNLEAPAGMLADTALDVTYPGAQQGAVVGVGRSVAFFGLLGCDTFAAGDAQLTGSITFRGYACDIAGEPYRVRARFETN